MNGFQAIEGPIKRLAGDMTDFLETTDEDIESLIEQMQVAASLSKKKAPSAQKLRKAVKTLKLRAKEAVKPADEPAEEPVDNAGSSPWACAVCTFENEPKSTKVSRLVSVSNCLMPCATDRHLFIFIY